MQFSSHTPNIWVPTGASAFQSPEATPSPKYHPNGSWLHSTDFLVKSGAYKVPNWWRFCLHKIVEGQGRADKSTGIREGEGKHVRGRKKKTESKRKPKPVTWLGKVPFQIQMVGVSDWGILG